MTTNEAHGRRRVTIGIDVGGTKIAGGVIVPATGEIIYRQIIPTDAGRGGPAILDDAVALARDMKAWATKERLAVAGIGVGVAELVDPAGIVRSGHVVGWEGLPVAERFAAVGPVRVESDVRAAALAEVRFGAGMGARHAVYVTVGTGISSTLVIDGVPFAGARGNALVLASGPTTTRCPVCGETTTVVLEDYASGSAISSRYAAATGRDVNGARAVLAAATEAGDPAAIEIIATAATALGSAIGLLINVTDPDLLILGGGLGAAPGPYQDQLIAAIRDHIWGPETRTLPIVRAAFGPDSGLLGAGLAGADATAPESPSIQPTGVIS